MLLHQRKTKHFIAYLLAEPFMVLQTFLKSMLSKAPKYLAVDGTLSSCRDVFEFPPQKIERKGGWEPCFEIGTQI